jgi:hypothetical protein
VGKSRTIRSLSLLAAPFTIIFGWLKWVLEADFPAERGASWVVFESSESEARCLAWPTESERWGMSRVSLEDFDALDFDVTCVIRGGGWAHRQDRVVVASRLGAEAGGYGMAFLVKRLNSRFRLPRDKAGSRPSLFEVDADLGFRVSRRMSALERLVMELHREVSDGQEEEG